MKLERRLFTAEFRAVQEADKPTSLVGYAAVFNQPSQDLGGYTEIIKPGAFTRTLSEGADVRALFNHDPSLILGRTRDGGKTGTLSLSQDNVGLRYELQIPDTQLGRDLLTLVQRGDITQNSFGFMVREQDWVRNGNQKVRELLDVDLDGGDVSPVTYPAYPQTTLEARSAFLFPNGIPDEIRKHLRDDEACSCACADCQDGNCSECSADPKCAMSEYNSLEQARLITAQLRTSLIRL